MKAPDILGLIIRIVGFFVIVYGAWNVVYAAGCFGSVPFGSGGEDDPLSYLKFGVLTVAFGSACFFGANWIVRCSYRNPPA